MQKSSIYLTQAERRRLAELSRLTGRSQAAIIREAIARYDPFARGDRSFALAGVVTQPGPSVSDIDEDELLDGFGG